MTQTQLERALKDLVKTADGLAAEVQKLRTRGRRWIAGLVLVILAMALTFTASALDTRHNSREADRRWCALLEELTVPIPDDGVESPARERSQRIVTKLSTLERSLGCPGG